MASFVSALWGLFSDFHNRTVAFRVGNFVVTTYTFFVAVAFLAGCSASLWFDAMVGQDPAQIARLHLVMTLPCVFLGLRISSILTEWPKLFRDPIPTIFRPGFMLHGGILAGAMALWILSRINHSGFLLQTDSAALGLAGGESIARLGCHVYGCCWGRPANRLPGIRYTNLDSSVLRNRPHLVGIKLHPIQLYSAAFSVALFLMLLKLLEHKPFDGALTATYCLVHSAGRFLLECLRDDNRGKVFGRLSHTNLYALLMVISGLALLAKRTELPNTPLQTDIQWSQIIGNANVLQFVIPFCLLISFAYGVHYKTVGCWVTPAAKD
jgi:phosphatidylglycerol:prolipoprotein diacylglycerol transferase